MKKQKILYSLVCIAGFAIAFIGLRVFSNALLAIAGILACLYGMIEVTHAFTAEPQKKSQSMYSPLDPDEAAASVCPHCGATVANGNDFCGKCGNKIS